MCLHIVLDVMCRFVFNTPVIGTLELVSNYYMIGAVFLPLAYVQHKHGHIMVTLFTYKLGPRTLVTIDAVIFLLWALAMLIFSWQTIEYAVEKTAVNESLSLAFYDLPLWPARWIPPVATSVLTLLLIVQSARGFVQAVTGEILPEQLEQYGHEIAEA